MHRRLAITGAVLGSTLFALGGATLASATRTVKINSQISIASHHNLTFTGRVSAGRAPCVNQRKVTLFRASGLKLGSLTTSGSGKWKLTVSGSAGITLGRFYAKVAQRSDGTAGTIYVCKAARSRTIKF